MSDTIMEQNTEATAATDNTETQAPAAKTYTQEEFDRHMAGLKSSLAKKYEKTFAELGDIEELRQLKQQAESKKLEEAKKRGEFEKVLQELAAKKDQEIQRRDAKIREYQINMPLLSAAAEFRAVNAEQVKSLLINTVRLNDEGEVEVVDAKGNVRYTDSGTPLGVKDLVKEFLDSNPHFVTAGAATTNTRSNVDSRVNSLDLSKLDMRNPEHRKLFAEMQKK
jgi:hypothetical protein